MLDFTSALYLGLRHASDDLRPWAQLTTGVPAALAEPRISREVAAGVAALIGVEEAALARSTLHAMFDLIPLVASTGSALYMDAGTYPVARWAAERARGAGVPLTWFRHRDPAALEQVVRAHARGGLRPVVVTDGLCTGCGGLVPVAAYAQIARRHGGQVVVDDTQALGILGRRTPGGPPLGVGGGGSLRWAGGAAGVTLVASLAKGFGAPLAIVAGEAGVLRSYRAGAETRVHSSPPSMADIHAAARALELNASEGDRRRQRLVDVVRGFRRGLQSLRLLGCSLPGPLQRLANGGVDAAELHRRLLAAGVRAVLHRSCTGAAQVTFVLTALHKRADVDAALRALEWAAGASEAIAS